MSAPPCKLHHTPTSSLPFKLPVPLPPVRSTSTPPFLQRLINSGSTMNPSHSPLVVVGAPSPPPSSPSEMDGENPGVPSVTS
jgi:hypothetical protein